MSALETKEKILDVTMALIKERKGDIGNVTIRMIADRAGIGVGLTNHYFKSKELLIGECVDNIMKDIFAGFVSAEETASAEKLTPIEATKRVAKSVMHFLLENEEVARVAFLHDAEAPDQEDYTARLVNSFAYCMVDRHQLEGMLNNDRISEKMKQQFREHFVSEQRRKAFMITASLKDAFLRRNLLSANIGIDLNNPEKCDEYIDEIVEMLM